MNNIKELVVGKTTETIIRSLFTERIMQESGDESLNTASRAMKIKDLSSQVLGFIKRNPNSKFEIISPEFKSDKAVTLTFSNFETYGETNEEISSYSIVINENFVEAEIVQKMKVGKDNTMRIKAREQ